MKLQRRFDPDPEKSYTLPGHYYFDPAIYAAETKAIFYKTWQFAGYLRDLAEIGDYVTPRIIDQHVLVVRDKKRQLRAFYNVSSHRGHPVGGRGRVARSPSLPAWTYRPTARSAAPYSNKVYGSTEHFRLEVQVEESLIWPSGTSIPRHLPCAARPRVWRTSSARSA